MKVRDGSNGRIHLANEKFYVLCEMDVDTPEIMDEETKITCNKCLRLLENERQKGKVKQK